MITNSRGSRIQNYVLEMNTSTNNPSHTVWNGRVTAPGWVMGAVPQTNINATYTYT
ncbi:hypothetical protein LDC_2515 [sediment metagenome]|uniref:Uncharacterized protein n=1 Tax=sediment metagenome TaxID=749907 RepID=D9PLT9_9ZZZZ